MMSTRFYGIILMLHLFCNIGSSQSIGFEKVFGSVGFSGFGTYYQFPDSGFFCTGILDTVSPFGNHPFMMRTDKYGNPVWTKSDTTSSQNLGQIIPLTDSLFYLVNGYGNANCISVSRINIYGDTIWHKEYGNLARNAGAYLCSDTGLLLFSNLNANYGLFKIDYNGNVEWHHDHPFWWTASNLKQDLDGGYIILGGDGIGNNPYSVAKYDQYGVLVWKVNYGDSAANNYHYATDVEILPDSNYLVSCNGDDFQFMKINHLNGDTIWTKSYNVLYQVDAMTAIPNHRIICISYCCKLFMIDENADTLWSRDTYLSPNADAVTVFQTNDGGFVYSGSYRPNSFTFLGLLVKTDSMGNTVVTYINDLSGSSNGLFYPNPASSTINFASNDFSIMGNFLFTLTTMQGKITMQQQIEKSQPIDVSNVKDGMYIAEVRVGSKVMRGKVVVQH